MQLHDLNILRHKDYYESILHNNLDDNFKIEMYLVLKTISVSPVLCGYEITLEIAVIMII